VFSSWALTCSGAWTIDGPVVQTGEGGEEAGASGGLKRRTSTRERAKPAAYNPLEQDLNTVRRRKELKVPALCFPVLEYSHSAMVHCMRNSWSSAKSGRSWLWQIWQRVVLG